MKRSEQFLLRQVAGKQVVVPLGKAAENFPGMLTLNDTGAYLWQLLETQQTEQSLRDGLCDHYEVQDREAVCGDIRQFLDKLRKVGALTEE